MTNGNGITEIEVGKKTGFPHGLSPWGIGLGIIITALIIAGVIISVVMPIITPVVDSSPVESDILDPVSAGEANTPLVANVTETPTPTVIATETSEADPTDSGSNVVFVTPTPEPTPTPIPEGTMLVPLDIPVTLEGADPKDVEMSLFYTGHSIKGEIKCLSPELQSIAVTLLVNDRRTRGVTRFPTDNILSFELETGHHNLSWINEYCVMEVGIAPQ